MELACMEASIYIAVIMGCYGGFYVAIIMGSYEGLFFTIARDYYGSLYSVDIIMV